MSKNRTLATFTAIIAVPKGDSALLLDWPDKPPYLIEPWQGGAYAADHGFEKLPTDVGIWRCTCDEGWNGEEPTYTVTASEKVLALGTCTATYEEYDEEEVPA